MVTGRDERRRASGRRRLQRAARARAIVAEPRIQVASQPGSCFEVETIGRAAHGFAPSSESSHSQNGYC